MVSNQAEDPLPEADQYAGPDPHGDYLRQLAILAGRVDPDLGNNPVVLNTIAWASEEQRFDVENTFKHPPHH